MARYDGKWATSSAIARPELAISYRLANRPLTVAHLPSLTARCSMNYSTAPQSCVRGNTSRRKCETYYIRSRSRHVVSRFINLGLYPRAISSRRAVPPRVERRARQAEAVGAGEAD